MERPLEGRVALVAGATRGAGRGIATMLGEAGATVYCTGRSKRGARSPMGRPETVEGTAERVEAAGGTGIPVHVDHGVPSEVEALVARILEEQSRLDLLVNDIWGGDPRTEWGKPFWQLEIGAGIEVVRNALETHLVTARYAVPPMVEAGRGLVVEVTDGDSYAYRGNLLYDLVKTSVIRLAFGMAEDLAETGVTTLAVTPGFLRSEAVLDHFGVTEETWREAITKDPNFAHSETPAFVGRAIAALAADPDVATKAGRVHASWTLAKEYALSDLDGRRPDWGAHFRATYGDVMRPLDDAFYAYWEGWQHLAEQVG